MAKRAIVKPIVTHPAVDHRVHRHRDFERRVRIHKRHQGQETVIRNAKNTDFAVGFGHVFHQPVDGVIGVGGVIHRSRILRPVQGPVHHIVALRAVLAANVLNGADVAAL